jgi:hypothetical protein
MGGREEGDAEWRWEKVVAGSCVSCSIPAAFERLQISPPPSEHWGTEGCFEMWQALSARMRAYAMKHKNLFPYQRD